MKIKFTFNLIIFALLPSFALCNPRVSISVDQRFLVSGESKPKISVAATNDVEGNYDVHIGIISPGGKIYEFPNWNINLQPWLKNFKIPAGFQLPITEISNLDSFQDEFIPGIWQAAVALTEPGTLNIVAFAGSSCAVVDRNNDGFMKIGSIFLAHSQFNPSDIFSGESTIAGAIFTSSDLNTANPNDLINDGVQNSTNVDNFNIPEINQCVFNKTTIPAPDTNIDSNPSNDSKDQSLDAGDISIFTADQSIQLDKMQSKDFITYSTAGLLGGGLYQGGATYKVESTGGADLSPFRASMVAPPPLKLQSPSLSDLAIKTGQDLNLVWNGNGGLGEIQVSLGGVDNTGSSIIFCRFFDDGNGKIESSLLKQLKDNVGDFTVGDITIPATVVLLVNGRMDYVLFNTDKVELDYGIFTIASSVNAKFNLE